MYVRTLVISLLLGAGPLLADTVRMKSGNLFQGEILSQDAGQVSMRVTGMYVLSKTVRPRQARSFDRIRTVYLKTGSSFTGTVRKLRNGDRIITNKPQIKKKYTIKVANTAWIEKAKTMSVKLRNGKTEDHSVVAVSTNKVVVEDINDRSGRREMFLTEVAEVKQGSNLYVDNKSNFMRSHRPQVRLGLSPIIPIGDVGTAVGMGLGAELSGSTRLFQSIFARFGMEFRAGLSVGYATFSSSSDDFDASLTMMPALAFGEISYPLSRQGIITTGLRPYLQLAGGISKVDAEKTFADSVTGGSSSGNASSSGSSIDGTARATLGAGYTLASLPSLEFFLNASFLMAFETVAGQFIFASLGASYRI